MSIRVHFPGIARHRLTKVLQVLHSVASFSLVLSVFARVSPYDLSHSSPATPDSARWRALLLSPTLKLAPMLAFAYFRLPFGGTSAESLRPRRAKALLAKAARACRTCLRQTFASPRVVRIRQLCQTIGALCVAASLPSQITSKPSRHLKLRPAYAANHVRTMNGACLSPPGAYRASYRPQCSRDLNRSGDEACGRFGTAGKLD